MTDIFKCQRCRQTFIQEEFEKHVCTPNLTGVKEVEFDYYYLTKDQKHRETIVIKGMDGIIYGFVKREKKASDKVPISDESLQSDQDDKNRRRFDRAQINNTFILQFKAGQP